MLQKLYQELELQLKQLHIDAHNTFSLCEKAIAVCSQSLGVLKQYIAKTKFKTKVAEIDFFKNYKPKIVSKLIYYTKILNIETKRPKGSDETQKKYLLNELDNLKRFFDNNLDFYQYYRTGATYLDEKYFLRGKHDVRLCLDTFFYISDPLFNTSRDFKIAKILANDLLEVYIKEELAKLDRQDNTSFQTAINPKVKLSWTDSKTALIELIYALYHQGCFNNAKAEVKEISSYFEAVFNIDLGNIYRAFLELRYRKIDRTKFLTTLTENLNKKMDEADER